MGHDGLQRKETSCWYDTKLALFTFSSPRVVHIRSKALAGIYWALFIGIWAYVLTSIFIDYEYLAKTDPAGVVSGWGEAGTMYTGNPDPAYCNAPYTADFDDGEFLYRNIHCTRFPMTDIFMKRTPSFQFITTAMLERTMSSNRCSAAGAACTASSTTSSASGAITSSNDDWCTCESQQTWYVQNVEGMNLVIAHDSLIDFASGSKYDASSASTKAGKKKMVTKLRNNNGDVVQEWSTPAEIKISVAIVLQLAGIDLDAQNADAANTAGQVPYYRLTGVPIVMNMEYKNYDVDGVERKGWHEHDDTVYCDLTVQVTGVWESLGSESATFPNGITYSQRAGTNKYDYTTTVVDRYRQGIKVIFKTTGSVGELDANALLTAVLNGVVLMGLATAITTFIGKHLYTCDGFNQIFKKFQDTECRPNFVLARSACEAAANVASFEETFDASENGKLDIRVVYENLRLLFGKKLTKSQIAQIVGDIVKCQDTGDPGALLKGDGQVQVDEFSNFLSDDTCDLVNVIEYYNRFPKGDKKYLKKIMANELPKKRKDKMDKIRNLTWGDDSDDSSDSDAPKIGINKSDQDLDIEADFEDSEQM